MQCKWVNTPCGNIGMSASFTPLNKHKIYYNVYKSHKHRDTGIFCPVVKTLSRGQVQLCYACWDDIEDSCQRTWPMWSKQRYKRLENVSSEDSMWPLPAQASDLLWSIVQAEKAYRQAPFLYTRPLVKGAVEALKLFDSDENAFLDSSLVPRTMLSIACVAGPLMWEDEMDALCAMIPDVRFQSLRQIEDCTRSLRMCRHKAWCMDTLDCAAHGVMSCTSDVSLRQASLIAQGIVYQRYVPKYTFQKMTQYIAQDGTDMDLKELGTLGAAVAYANCLDIGETTETRALIEMLIDRIEKVCGRTENFSYNLHGLHPFLLWYSTSITNTQLLQESMKAREDAVLRKAHTISTFQREVFDVLTSYMGFSCEMEQTISGISVDITIPRLCTALEINGPSHYYRNVDMMIPATEFKEKIIPLAQPGWRLVHVEQRVWNDLVPSRREKAGYLESLIHCR